MGQCTPPNPDQIFMTVDACVSLDGEARRTLSNLDWLVRSTAVTTNAGLSLKERALANKALVTVLMSITCDMAFASSGLKEKDLMRIELLAVLDDCLAWSHKRIETFSGSLPPNGVQPDAGAEADEAEG